MLGTLEGHTDSVRCLDVYGDMIVSGSYDCSVRVRYPTFSFDVSGIIVY